MNKPAPFSMRQYEYMQHCLTSWFNVAEGGKRGGKNVLQTLIFCMLLEEHENKIHLVAGVSVATAKLNILDCDGYGLLNYFEGRCREGKYKDRDCVYVQTKTGEKIVLVSGGGKNGDEKLIKGNTYGMAYITEANECHPQFLKETFDRTISSTNRKVFHDLNPKDPEDWYYTEILRFHEEQQEADSEYGYNYGHFTLVDNMSLSDEKIREAAKDSDMIISVGMQVGDTSVTNFSDKVSISVDYTVPDGKDASLLYVAYLKGDGSIERIGCTFANGVLSFETDHFSYDAVMYDTERSSSDDGSDNTLIIAVAVVAVIIVLGCAFVFFRMRSRAE